MDETVREFRVRDAERELRFKGTFLGQASSRHRGNDRWIEFTLFRTQESGKYILARVGKSSRFHVGNCSTVAKNPHLPGAPLASIDIDASPCPECLPDGDEYLADNAIVFPEEDRPWAGVLDKAQDVIDLLTLVNAQGVSYLTHVARDLLESAATKDKDISNAYYVVTVV